MLATALRVLQIALAAACVYLVYGTVSPLLGATELPGASLPEIDLPLPEPLSFASLEVIERRNLFHPEDDAPILALAEEIVESKLRVELVGTAAVERPEGDPANPSVAILRDNRGEHVTVRVGDEVAGASVEGIEARRVLVRNRGKLEQIRLLEDDDAPRATRGAQASARRVARRTTRRSTPRAARRTREVRSMDELAGKIATQAQAHGETDSGASPPRLPEVPAPEVDPFAADALGALFPEAELEEGDRVLSINDVELADEADLVKALADPGPKTFLVQSASGAVREVEVDTP